MMGKSMSSIKGSIGSNDGATEILLQSESKGSINGSNSPSHLYLKLLPGDDFQIPSGKYLRDELFDRNYANLLYFTGLYFPLDFFDGTWLTKLQVTWALLLRGMLLFSNLFIAFTSASYGYKEDFHMSLKFLFTFCIITIAMQSFVLLTTMDTVSKKLHKICLELDLKIYEETNYQCIGVFWLSFFSGLLLPIYYILCANNILWEHIGYIAIAVLGEFSIAVFLVATIMVIVVDCRVVCSLLDMLKDRFMKRTLTISLFDKVRDEVKKRVDESYWMSNSVVLVAIVEIITLVLILLCASVMTRAATDDGEGEHHPFDVTFVVFMATFFVKELPFLLLVLWHSAKVNAKSDRLIKLMGVSWQAKDCSDPGNDNDDAEKADTTPLLAVSPEKELLRQALYINAEADRISMPLAFMRLKKRDIYVRFSLWVVSLLIGIVKAVIDLHVENVTK